jgi:glycerol-1-phosphatase
VTTLASHYKRVIVDLDGVVYLGTHAIPAAARALHELAAGGTAVTFATNNASRRADEVAGLLVSVGVPATAEQVVTSGHAAAMMLARWLPPGSPILVVGAPALRDEVVGVGLAVVMVADEQPAAVVQGYGPTVGWADLAEACVAIRAGARWVATNTDATVPSPRGPLPGNGSLIAALSTALGGRVPDDVIGKPYPAVFELAALGCPVDDVIVVGDRLDTDIAGAVAAGMDSLLVLTGVSAAADLLRASASQRPTHVWPDLSGLSTSEDDTKLSRENPSTVRQWRAHGTNGHLALEGSGAPIDALRALAAAAWAYPEWSSVEPEGAQAARVVDELGLAARASS